MTQAQNAARFLEARQLIREIAKKHGLAYHSTALYESDWTNGALNLTGSLGTSCTHSVTISANDDETADAFAARVEAAWQAEREMRRAKLKKELETA